MILIMATIIAQGKMNHEGFAFFLTLSSKKNLLILTSPFRRQVWNGISRALGDSTGWNLMSCPRRRGVAASRNWILSRGVRWLNRVSEGKSNFWASWVYLSSSFIVSFIWSKVGRDTLFKISKQTRPKKTTKVNPQLNIRAKNILTYQGESLIASYRKKA
jgi:hypothetical protein